MIKMRIEDPKFLIGHLVFKKIVSTYPIANGIPTHPDRTRCLRQPKGTIFKTFRGLYTEKSGDVLRLIFGFKKRFFSLDGFRIQHGSIHKSKD